MGKHLVETIDLVLNIKDFRLFKRKDVQNLILKLGTFNPLNGLPLQVTGGVTPDLKAAPDAKIKEHNAAGL